MSDEENEKQPNTEENSGRWIQSAITFIKKLPSNTTRIAKGAAKGIITEIKEDTMKENTIGRNIETHIKFDLSLKSWQEKNLKAVYHKLEKYKVEDGREKESKNINPEWGASFIDKSKNISDEDMQTIWAKILTGERDNPGTFSKKTLSVVSDMSKEDAKLFTSLCQFIWLDDDARPVPIIYDAGSIYDTGNLIYNQRAINFSTLQHLESIGLISFRASWWYYPIPQPVIWHYYGTVVTLSPKYYPKKNNYYVPTGEISLTQSGAELFRIYEPQKNNEFFNYVIDKWQTEGLKPVIQNSEIK